MNELEVLRDIFRELADLTDELILMEVREERGEKISKEEIGEVVRKILYDKAHLDYIGEILR